MEDKSKFRVNEGIAKALRKAFRERDFWRMNLVNADSEDEKEQMTEAVLDRGVVSLSDWGALRHGEPVITVDFWVDSGKEIVEGDIDEDLRDDITGDVEWGLFTDRLHQWQNTKTRVKAGKAKGVIRKFLFEFEVGDVLLLNTSKGTVIAVVTGPARVLDENAPHRAVDGDHIFGREVEFVVDEDGEVVTFDTVPEEVKPNQNTITSLDRDALKGLLEKAEALTAMAVVGEWDTPDKS